MSRTVAHFSCGAASAIATKISEPDEIWYCATGSEDKDNARFMRDFETWIGRSVRVIKSKKFADTWDVWEKRKFLAGVAGAPCTSELKVLPRVAEQLDDDIHIFGYTADASDMRRARLMSENWPELTTQFPLIDRGITKTACLALLESAGIKPPRVYAMGFDNANCIPCVKATSPSYWALVRREFPAEFRRMAEIEKRLGATLTRVGGERVTLSQIPDDHPVTEPISPACDFLCGLAERDILEGE